MNNKYNLQITDFKRSISDFIEIFFKFTIKTNRYISLLDHRHNFLGIEDEFITFYFRFEYLTS